MRPFTDDGMSLNANFALEQNADGFDLILESWSGPRPDGSPPRNPDYNSALDLLLARLGQVGTVLRSGVVDSREMQGRPLIDRQLDLPDHAYPVALGDVRDFREFRLEMGRAQRVIGREPGTRGGNSTKRIRLSLSLPNPWSVTDLETFLVKNMSEFIPDPLDEDGEQDALDPSSMQSLWDRYKNANPIVKERISRRIERGSVGSMVKKANNYRCQICDSLNQPWMNFTKPNGDFYIEAHHVVPVSALGVGVLGPGNVITVCPNHHRQLHFGRVEVTDNGDTFWFVFDDDQPINIQKFCQP